MEPIHKREDQELVNVIRNVVSRFGGLTDLDPRVASAALDELERRHCNRGSVLARLARVEEDLAAFKREHAERIFPGTGKVGLAMFPGSTPTLTPEQTLAAHVRDTRTNAENRAWQCFEDWRALEIKKPENSGNVYEVRIKPPVSADDWDAEIWFESYSDRAHGGQGGTVHDVVVAKRGTSRVDALAHVASWCQAEMPDATEKDEQGNPYCGHDGPCGVGVPKCVQETVKI